MICVDLGGGVSTTIDDFIIPCPATTECNEKNIFECDFPEVTTPALQVIGVNKPSDISEPTLVTNSVTTPTPTSDIFSVLKENITAATLANAEDVTPVVKLEVLKNFMNRVGVNNENITETSVTSSSIVNKNDIFNDNQTSNNTITTSATDNNKHLENIVETSTHEAANISLTDKSTSIDTVTSVIGFINLISTDPPSVVSTKPPSNVLTSLDSSNDNITTTEQYKTKGVTIHGIKVTDKLNADIIVSGKSLIKDEVSTTPVQNTLILNALNNKTYSGYQTIAEQDIIGKSNNSNEIVPETTTKYAPPIKNVNISKLITVGLSLETTTDNTLAPLGLVNLISAEQKQSTPSSYDTFLGDTTTTTNKQFNTKLETTLSVKPVIVETISTTPIANNIVQNVLKNDKNNYSDGEIVTVEKVTETNTYSTFSESTTVTNMQASTENTFVPITTAATMVYTKEMIATSQALDNNDFLVQKQTILSQPSEIIIATDLPIIVTDNFYQINGELTKNISFDTMNITARNSTVYNDSGTDVINNKVIEPVLLQPHSMKNPAIEITTIETLQKGFTSPAIDLANESLAIIANSISEPSIKNDKNDTLLNNMTTVNAISSDIANGKGTKPIIKQYPTIEIPTIETVQNEFTKHAEEAKNKLPATSDRVNENYLENVEVKALLSIHATNSPYEVTTGPVKDTIIKDLPSKSDIATNQQTGFTPEIIAHKASDNYTFIDYATTQKAVVNSVSKIPQPLNQPDNLEAVTLSEIFNVDQITDPDVVSTTTISFNNIENKATTPFPSDVSRNTSISEVIKSGDQNNTSTTNVVDTEDESLKIIETSTSSSNQNAIEFSSTIPETVHITTNMDSIKMFKQASANTSNIADIDRVSMTPTAINKTVSHFVHSTETTAIITVTGFETKNLDFQTSLVNSTEILNPIKYTNSVNATFPESKVKTNKDEGIKIVSALDIVNSSGNAMPIEMSQPTSLNRPLTNDLIKTSESQASSVYVSATDNVPDYNSVHVEESATQKSTEAIITIADTKIIDMVVSKPRPHNLPVSELNKGKDQYVSTEAPISTTVQLIKLTTTGINYVAEKTDGYFSTEITPDTATPDGFTKVPVYDEVTKIKDTAFITSSTQMTPEVVTDNNIKMSTESPRLTLKVMKPQTVYYETESSLPYALMANEFAQTTTLVQTKPLDKTGRNIQSGIKSAMPSVNNNIPRSIPSLPIVGETATQITTEPTDAALFTETTPLAVINKLNQNVQIRLKTTQLPQYYTSKENNNSPQSMPLLLIVEPTTAKNTTKLNLTTIVAQTTPLTATGKPNQDVLPEIKATDLPQYVMSTVNNNIPQSISSLPTIRVTASQISTESTHTELFAQTKPLAATGNTNLGVLSGIKSADLPQYVSSTVGSNTPKSKPLLPLVEVTAAQFTTEPIHETNISETTPLAAPSTTFQNILPGIKTTDLSQYATTTVNYYNAQSISDITTKTIVDSITAPDSMVETIKVVGDKESGTHLGGKFLSDVMFNTPTVDNVKSVKNVIDHENIVVGATSKNDEENTSIASAKPVDINKAEAVNQTASNWMPADLNIDSVKIKESSIKEDDLKSLVLKSVTDFKNKTLVLNSSKISQIQPNDGKSVDKIEYRLTTETTNYKEAESGAPKNVTQSKSIIPNGNKNAKTNSSQYFNIELIDSKKDHVPVDSKNILDNYSINNTKANNISSNNNLSLQNSTINEELEQHLISTNHTITTEIQSHLNESDKQSNKTSNLLTLNGTSVHTLKFTSTNKNARSKNTVPVSVFNCTNLARGKYSDKKDCRKFYSCIGTLQPILGTCPNNTVFSEINKQCTRNLSHCVRNNQFRCLFEGRFSDFFKDNIYYICVKNRINGFIRYKLQCQDSYYLNKDLVKCEKNEEISTQTGYFVSETIIDESKPHSEKMVSSDDFECEKVGKFPYAKDCSKYYECTKVKSVYRRKIKKCASDEVFDTKKKKCVESDSREC